MRKITEGNNTIEAERKSLFFQLIPSLEGSQTVLQLDQEMKSSAYILIYIKKGCSKVTLLSEASTNREEICIQMKERMFLLILPGTVLRFEKIDTNATDFDWIEFHGGLTKSYLSDEDLKNGFCYLEHSYSMLFVCFEKLCSLVPRNAMENHIESEPHYRDPFYLHQAFTDFMTIFHESLQLNEQKKKEISIPEYLSTMYSYFDTHYALSFTLDDVVELCGISKYKFCHDFKYYYGYSPLQHINKLRISHAAEFLITENIPIHEIGSMVGIDNTNHFINLFKRYMGVTPLVYRQAKLEYLNKDANSETGLSL